MQRYNRTRSVTVTDNVLTGYNTDRVTSQALGRLARLALPYRIVPAREIESREESFGGIGGAILVAIFGILAILVLEFRTFRSRHREVVHAQLRHEGEPLRGREHAVRRAAREACPGAPRAPRALDRAGRET